jgi:hypothetical protein
MYTILDARTVMIKKDGKPQEANLIRIQNPWNDASEWCGACCDMDEKFWTQEVKDAFNSHDQLVEAGADKKD